jgi:hypothetical protein
MQALERDDLAEPPDADFVQRVLKLALGQGWQAPQPQQAWALLQTRQQPGSPTSPSISATVSTPKGPATDLSAWLALWLVQGDLPTVQQALAGAHVHELLPPLQAPALAYAAGSSLARIPALRAGLVATVQWLLDQGADANTRWADPARPESALNRRVEVRRLVAAAPAPAPGGQLGPKPR